MSGYCPDCGNQHCISLEMALHDIEQIEDAIRFEQDLIDKKIYKTEQKIKAYKDRIEELKKIAFKEVVV
jgi:hypothetical protein